MLDRLFRRSGTKPPPISYEQEKEIARSPDSAVRADLAARRESRPEILYFLAEDESPVVRRAIARNPNAPRQADRLLATDVDDEVRLVLARKIGRLLPDLDAAEAERLQDLTFEVLAILARDQLPRVRQIIAEEIKHARNVPPEIVRQLARDIELIVAAPVLQYSVLLNDHDLLEIIANAASAGVLAAISKRSNLSESVCDAIVAGQDEGAIASLLSNDSAQIREETLDNIIASAPGRKSWHEPLVRRPRLSASAARRIAGFVAAALLDALASRTDLDPATQNLVRRQVKERLKAAESGAAGDADEAAYLRAKRAFEAGRLDDETVRTAVEEGQRAFVDSAIALRAGLALDVVRRITVSQAGRPITALCWRAKLSMRTAMSVQRRHARLSAGELVNARNGVDYPMTEEEMRWFVAYFEKPARREAPAAAA